MQAMSSELGVKVLSGFCPLESRASRAEAARAPSQNELGPSEDRAVPERDPRVSRVARPMAGVKLGADSDKAEETYCG